jgi:cytochrome bd ubiquinol oxidase subunit II
MTAAMADIRLPEVLALIIGVSLNVYVLTGGADFGGGVWDLFARGRRADHQRALIAESIGPIWEANHVWLIIVIVLLFSAFPAVYADVSTILHIPLTLILIGIVLRGSAFVFRSYGSTTPAAQQRWGTVFAVASTITPIFLGVVIGALVSGDVGKAATLLVSAKTGSAPSFQEVYIASWMHGFSLMTGMFALELFAFLAAVYLAARATDPALREDFRRRALIMALLLFVTAFGTLTLAHREVPEMATELSLRGVGLAIHAVTGVSAIVAISAVWMRRWWVARIAAGAQVSGILWGWLITQYPYLIPPIHTIQTTAAPDRTLELILSGLAIGGLLLIPSLLYLYRLFLHRTAADV